MKKYSNSYDFLSMCCLCGVKEADHKHHVQYEPPVTIPVCVKCHNAIHALKKELNLKRQKPLICKCGYSWKYQGASTTYATCPNCLKKVKIGSTLL